MADNPPQDPQPNTLGQCLDFLSRKDDTSRFVGLAMLSSVLNRVQDQAVLRECWDALDPRFLDRLLKSGETKPPEEAADMIDLAVNVLHAFATSLPDAGSIATLSARSPALIKVLPRASKITAATILQTLLVFAASPAGAQSVLKTKDLSPLVQVMTEHEPAAQVLQYAFVNTAESSPQLAKDCLQAFLPSVVQQLGTADRTLRLRLLSFLSELLSRIPSDVLPSDDSWVESTYSVIRSILTASHTSQERSYSILIIASLLHAYSPTHLFSSTATDQSASKPFLYLLLQLTTIDLRATFPSLLETIASPSYATTASRLAADYDIVAAFLGYLVTLEDFAALTIPPDLLLKLRKDLAETFSLTVEFLRDRWDAAYAGAAGFEPGFEQGVPKQLAWTTTLPGGLERDPLVIGAVRALSLWLREDESLRKEAGGLMDLFLGLWEKGADVGVDYRMWIVGALEGVLEERNGREMFLKLGGWDMLWKDLKSHYVGPEVGDGRLAIAEAGVLADVVVAERVANESWAREACRAAAATGRWELDAAVLRLAVKCLAPLHHADRRKMKEELEKMRDICERIAVEVSGKAEETAVLETVLEAKEELGAL